MSRNVSEQRIAIGVRSALFCLCLGFSALAQEQAQPASGQRIDAATAVRRALSANPSVRASRLGVEQARQGVVAEEGRYPYVFRAEAGHTRSASPRLDANDRVTTSYSRAYDVAAGLRRTFPFGTTAEVRVQGQYFDEEYPFVSQTGTISSGGSGYAATARASLVHPLLRGSGTDTGEIGLRVARQNRTLSEKSERRALSELTRDVLAAYYELWYADEAVRIEDGALELARRQEQEALAQQSYGALAPADVYAFSTRVAALEESMVSARLARRQRSLELNRLMGVSPATAPELSAADAPEPGTSPSAREIEAALRSDSVELAELEAQLRVARTRAEVAGDVHRPRLDLEGFVQTDGQSDRAVTALGRAGQLNWLTVHVGAVFELPLERSAERAERETALLAVRIAEQNLKAARDRLGAEAALAVQQARASEERLGLAARTVEVAERSHAAARARYELGGGIAIQVQQAEEELRRARLSLARTRVDLMQAQIAMRHLAGSLSPAG